MMLVLLLLTPAFEFVCRAALAAVIIFAFSSLLSQLSIGLVYWRLDRSEFWAWCLSLVVVLVFDVEIGLAAGLLFGAISLAYRKTHPMIDLLALRSDLIHETSTSTTQSASIALQCLTRQPQPIEHQNSPQYTPLGSEHDSVLGPTSAPSPVLSFLCCQSPTVVFDTSPLHGLHFVRVHVPITQTLAEHLPRLIAGLLPERSSVASSDQNGSYQIQSSDETEAMVLIIESVGWCDLDAETERQLDLLPTKLAALLPHLSIAVHLVCSSGTFLLINVFFRFLGVDQCKVDRHVEQRRVVLVNQVPRVDCGRTAVYSILTSKESFEKRDLMYILYVYKNFPEKTKTKKKQCLAYRTEGWGVINERLGVRFVAIF
jgi:hypothetical protein